jgi:hypothetical protein
MSQRTSAERGAQYRQTEQGRRKHREAEQRRRARQRGEDAPKLPQNGDKTHCPAEHEYAPENTYRDPDTGHRRCRACHSDQVKSAYAADPELGRQQSWQRREQNKDTWNKAQREKRASDPEPVRERDRMRYAASPRKRDGIKFRRHGMTAGEWDTLYDEQQGCCYLCGGDLGDNLKHIHIDHDHRCCPPTRSCSKCRRGLACNRCNVIAGWAHDDAGYLRIIAASLEAAVNAVTERLREEAECKT